jgi:hypothetical protein
VEQGIRPPRQQRYQAALTLSVTGGVR